MRIDQSILLVLAFIFASCDHDRVPQRVADLQDRYLAGTDPTIRTAADPEIFAFDIIQRTCALYVAVRSGTFKGPAAFDREINASMVRWNMCDGGTMVACAAVPDGNGDTVRVGIPWPYDRPAHF